MVVLNKIYTKTGDSGETALGDGMRVAKHALRVSAYGTSDELNSVVGVARLHSIGELDAMLLRIQNDLFDLGADLCRPNIGDDIVIRAVIANPLIDERVLRSLISSVISLYLFSAPLYVKCFKYLFSPLIP